MISAIRRACEYDLGFPYRDDETPSTRLAAIASFMEGAGHGRDFFLSGACVEALEDRIATLFGKQAALWCPTGTMAQAIALRIHKQGQDFFPIAVHPSSHLLLHEKEGYKYAHSLDLRPTRDWSAIMSAEDLDGDLRGAVLELPQRHNGGQLPGWEQLHAIKQKAKVCNIALHLDGARIWACRPYYGEREYAEIVDGFASIYVSLYKDIGALGGAMLVGDTAFIEQARIWRERLGGLMSEPWVLVADALRLLDLQLPKLSGFVERARHLANRAKATVDCEILPEVPHTNMFHLRLPCRTKRAERARDQVAVETGLWLGTRFWNYASPDISDLEIVVGQKALDVPDDIFRRAVELLVNGAQ
jgi:threonine aldolase